MNTISSERFGRTERRDPRAFVLTMSMVLIALTLVAVVTTQLAAIYHLQVM